MTPNVYAGNKRFKLLDNLILAQRENSRGVIGFGGAWSNFIHSLAYAAHEMQLPCVGVIRGIHHNPGSVEVDNAGLNDMLSDACELGMRLRFVSHADYRLRHDPRWLESLKSEYPGYHLLPEGGSNLVSANACRSMIDPVSGTAAKVTHWFVAVGTGATVAGLAASVASDQQLIGCQVIKDTSVRAQAEVWSEKLRPGSKIAWCEALVPRYGKLDQRLCELINMTFEQTGVLLDPLYSVKALQCATSHTWLWDEPGESCAAVIHTGGLQAWRGMVAANRKYLSSDVLAAISRLEFVHTPSLG